MTNIDYARQTRSFLSISFWCPTTLLHGAEFSVDQDHLRLCLHACNGPSTAYMRAMQRDLVVGGVLRRPGNGTARESARGVQAHQRFVRQRPHQIRVGRGASERKKPGMGYGVQLWTGDCSTCKAVYLPYGPFGPSLGPSKIYKPEIVGTESADASGSSASFALWSKDAATHCAARAPDPPKQPRN